MALEDQIQAANVKFKEQKKIKLACDTDIKGGYSCPSSSDMWSLLIRVG